LLVSYIQNFALHFSAFAHVSLPYLHCRFRNITLKAASKFREHVCQSRNNRSALSEANHQAFSNFPDKHEEPSVNVRIYGGPIELQAPALQRLPDLLPPRSGALSLARCFNAGQVSVRMRRSRERSRRRSADRRLRSPESEGRIIATSGGRPDEVIENTGRIDFWRKDRRIANRSIYIVLLVLPPRFELRLRNRAYSISDITAWVRTLF
jgi:hypothetical protein